MFNISIFSFSLVCIFPESFKMHVFIIPIKRF